MGLIKDHIIWKGYEWGPIGGSGGKTLEFNKRWPLRPHARLTGPSSTNLHNIHSFEKQNPSSFLSLTLSKIKQTWHFKSKQIRAVDICFKIPQRVPRSSEEMNKRKSVQCNCQELKHCCEKKFQQSFPILWTITINLRAITFLPKSTNKVNLKSSLHSHLRSFPDNTSPDEVKRPLSQISLVRSLLPFTKKWVLS